MHRPLPLLAAIALTPVLALAGCGIDRDVVAREAASAPTSSTSSTTSTTAPAPTDPAPSFTVAEVPEGHRVRVEGPGDGEAPASDEVPPPVTVLAPDGEPVGPGVVLVEAVPGAEDGFTPATDEEPWAARTADGVRVWAVGAGEAELAEIADAATAPTVAGAAPTVEDPPGDLEVVGSIGTDGLAGLAAPVPDDPDGPIPGPATAQVAVYVCDEDCDGSLVVMTLPAGALDPEAIVTETRLPRRAGPDPLDSIAEDLEDLDGVLVTTADPETGTIVRRTLAAELADGTVLLVVARADDAQDPDLLLTLARSVEPD